MANETEFERLQRAFLAADRAGDVEAAKMLAQSIQQAQQQMDATHSVSGSAGTYKPESEAFKSGRALPEYAQRGLHLGDVLSMGMVKKIMSPEGEQMVRGAKAEFAQNRPWESGIESVVGSMAPAAAGGGAMLLEPAAARGVGAVAGPWLTGGVAAMQSVPQGAIQGVGESESRDPIELAKAAAIGGTVAGVLGGAGSAVGQAGMGITRNMAARTTKSGALSDAQRELAKALQRDVPYGSIFDQPGSMSTPAGLALARLKERTVGEQTRSTLGPEARLIDVGGANTRALGDVLASMPGKAPQAFARAIRERKAGRADRLITAADEALGTSGKQYAPTIEALVQERSAAAGPLYDQLRGVAVPVDPKMAQLLAASRSAHRDSELLSELRQQTGLDLDKLKVGDSVPFDALDALKQSLYDLEVGAKTTGATNKASAYTELRRELTSHMDDVLPKDATGKSIYAQAREAYAGPSQIVDAVETGRSAFNEEAPELAALVGGLSQGEQEGFRIGALQALRKKAGSKAGATQLLGFWEDKNVNDKLKLIFGNDFKQFKAALLREDILKKMEQTAAGSPTFKRLQAAEDLGGDLASGAADVAAATQTGNVVGGLSGIGKVRKAIALPESTRNQLAQMLLQRGGDAQATLKTLDQVIRNMNIKRARGTALAGALGAQGQQTLFPQQ